MTPLAPLASEVAIGGSPVATARPPRGYLTRAELGILAHEDVQGQVVFQAAGTLFETRATVTPGGDYLLMFPTNTGARPEGRCHYGGAAEKVNDLVAFRSSDRGRSWSGPTVPMDIDYNLHGFVPLVPRGSQRVYCFGTQPIWGMHTRENGLQENAPVGYRYSDDDGLHWSEVRLIRPANDPGFTGMAVMRMCETEAGSWLIAPHEGDWSYKPLMTRLYLMRSRDQGATWELLPGKRHGGWQVRAFGRMDEGRPIDLGGGKVLLMARTPEGHLWELRSEDDGASWGEPRPTPLVHPDAPPMVFHLSDGRTLAAFHHNRHHDRAYGGLSVKPEIMKDRSEVWVALSSDGGLTWSEPRFLFVNAFAETEPNAFFNYQCSYLDMFVDGGRVHLFVPHRWKQVLHLSFDEALLERLPDAAGLARR